MRRFQTSITQSISVGETTIHWLSAATSILDEELEGGLHADEIYEAQKMRSQSRREEFRRTRFLIRKLTGVAAPLVRLASGAPQWPPGYIGSITHKDGAVGVALDQSSDLYGLGIDAEHTRINLKLEPRILQAQESRLLDAMTSRSETLAAAFAFKEAIFKACFPRGGMMFYFHDAEILAIEPRQMTARLLLDVGPETPASTIVQGNYEFFDDLDAHGQTTRFALCSVRISSKP